MSKIEKSSRPGGEDQLGALWVQRWLEYDRKPNTVENRNDGASSVRHISTFLVFYISSKSLFVHCDNSSHMASPSLLVVSP